MARQLESSLVMSLIDRVSAPARGIAGALTGIGGAVRNAQGRTVDFGTRLDAAITRNNNALAGARAGLADAVVGYYALTRAIGGPIRAAAAFEDAMADVRKVVDFPTPESLHDFEQALFALSQRVPIAVDGLAAMAAAAGQAGIAREQIIPFVEAAAQIGTAFDISADEAGAAMANLMTALGRDVEGAMRLADAINHLSNNQASAAAGVLDVVRRVGAQATMFGFTAEQTAAFGSAMIAAGAQSDVAATSFRNMGAALTRGVSATSAQRRALGRLGLDATDVARRMQEDAVATTIDVLERIGELPDELRAAVSTDLFGAEARALGPLLTNLDLLRTSLGLVANETDYVGSATREFEARNATFNAALQRFQNLLNQVAVSIGSALLPGLNRLLEILTPLATGVADFADQFPNVTAGVIAATSAVVGLRIAMAALRYVGLLGRGGVLSLIALGYHGVYERALLAAEGARAYVAVQRSLAASAGASLTRLEAVGAALRGIGLAVPGVGAMSAALTAVGGALAAISAPAWGGIAAAVLAVAAAGLTLWKYWQRVSAFVGGFAARIAEAIEPLTERLRPAFDWLAGAFAPVTRAWGAAADYVRETLSGLWDWLGGLFSQEVLTDEQRAGYEASGRDLADRIINGITSALARLGEVGASIANAVLNGARDGWLAVQDWATGRAAAAAAAVSTGIGAMVEAGRQLVQSLWDGAVERFNAFIEWVTSWPRRIVDAIGSIDLSDAIRLPAFLGGSEPAPAPPVTNARLQSMRAEVEAARDEVAALEAQLAGIEGPVDAFDPGSEAWQAATADLEGARAVLATLERALADAEAQAHATAGAIGAIGDLSVEPEIRTGSLDRALDRARELDRLVRGSSGGSAPAPASPDSGRLPGRASGGPVSAGQVYTAAERGWELLAPTRSGYVHTMSSLTDILAGAGQAQFARLERLIGQAGRSVSLGGVSVSVPLHLSGVGAADAEAIAQTVLRRIGDEIGAVLSGVAADPALRS